MNEKASRPGPAAVLLAVLVSLSLVAQTTKGRIVGAVTDTSGAVVAGVQVKIRNLRTNAVFSALTSDAGGFVFPDLLIGQYEASAEIPGFKRYVQGPLDLLVDQTLRVDIRLEVGNITEQVTVQAGAPVIQTDQSGVGQVVENQTVVQLPLNGRNFVRLGSLMPGTTRGSPGDSTRRERQQGELLTANGQRAEHNNFMLDGAENNSAIEGTAVIIPSIDAIQEFKVQTSNYSAEFGRAGGAIVNIAIKSGSNQLHGAAYEFLRNDKLDARDFFDVGVTPLRRNQFGFAAGGPVIRDRAFLFGNFEWVRERRTNTRGFVVPDEVWRRGDFTGQPAVYDPLDLDASGNRRPFPGSRIPDSRINSISGKIMPRWPVPNNPADRARNYLQNFNDPLNQNQFHLRGDVRLTDKDQLMARVSRAVSEDNTQSIGLNGESNNLKPKGGVVGWTRVLSPTAINEARFSAYMFDYEFLPEGLGRDYPAELGLPTLSVSDNAKRFPVISVRNIAGIGGGITTPLFRKEINYQWIDQFTWIRGAQTVKFGADARRLQTSNFAPQYSAGQYVFNGPFTGQKNRQYANGFADFLLGLPTQQTMLDPATYDAARLRNTRVSLYVQDDINLSSRLTLNAGIRWERDGDWTEKNNRWTRFDYQTGVLVYPRAAKLPVAVPYPHRFEDNRSMKAPTNKAFAPRFGFAWRPSSNNKTVVRSGYGISWGQPLVFLMNSTSESAPPFTLRSQLISSNETPELRFGVFPIGAAGQLVPGTPSFNTLDPGNLANGYVQQWNFGVEREVRGSIAAKASYVGSKGTHLERRYEGNAALPPGPGPVNARRRYPQFQQITQQESSASSTYHSLQLSGEKRFAKGLMFLAGYTWSKTLDDASSWNPNSGSSPWPQNPSNLRAEKGRSAFDLRRRFTLSYVYELPLRSSIKPLHYVVAGWQTSGIVTLQTGFPTTPTVGGDIPNAGTRMTRPNLTGEGNLPPAERTLDRWFNTRAFSSPTPFTFGNAGRTIIDMPGTRALDFSAMKVFRITEQHRLQFRAEFFNFLNHPSFGSPNVSVDNPGFGAIRSGGAGREVQLGLKYIF